MRRPSAAYEAKGQVTQTPGSHGSSYILKFQQWQRTQLLPKKLGPMCLLSWNLGMVDHQRDPSGNIQMSP